MIENNEKMVYMTVLTNVKYVPGVIALKNALKKVKSKYDLVILLPTERENEIVQLLSEKKVLDSKCFYLSHKYLDLGDLDFFDKLECNHWRETFFKLCVTDCIQFKKIVLLDSDMLILHNIDELFFKPHYSAVPAGKTCEPSYTNLNSGLMVIEPNSELFDNLLNSAKETVLYFKNKNRACGDQNVFQNVFPDWEKQKELELPEIYNCFYYDVGKVCKKNNYAEKDIKVIHYVGAKKPWTNGIYTKQNFKKIFHMCMRGRFSQAKNMIKYLYLSKKVR